MGKIITLPEAVVRKTAAGEVVEDPASVVKELLDNAIDAGADSIKISVTDGGKGSILVVDNGSGMSKEDLLLSWQPHTSSKIHVPKDLDSIKSLGFRGEALSSISEVSDLTIKTKETDEVVGWSLNVSYGIQSDPLPCGIPTGTSVEVKNLFSNLPARRGFLKDSSYELRKIADLVSSFALAYPQKDFLLNSNGRLLLNFPPQYNLEKRIETILGENVPFLPLDFSSEHIRFSGYVSFPQYVANSGSCQYTFLNGRVINWRKGTLAIKRAYGTLLDKNSFPKFVLFAQIPAEFVDVNIHPRKEKVRLKNEERLLKLLEEAVKNVLDSGDVVYQYDFSQKGEFQPLYSRLNDSVSFWEVDPMADSGEITDVLQFDKTYLLVSLKDRILLIDQHAAHEKILYGQILEYLRGEVPGKIKLDDPIPLKSSLVLGPCEEDALKKIGIKIIWREDRALVSEVPEIFKDLDLEFLVETILETGADNFSLEYSHAFSKAISTLACKNAVKAGDYLTPDQRIHLVKKLLDTQIEKYTCPHGRPTMVELHKRAFEKLFRRK